VGANHNRERWWLLAHSNSGGGQQGAYAPDNTETVIGRPNDLSVRPSENPGIVADPNSRSGDTGAHCAGREEGSNANRRGERANVANSDSKRELQSQGVEQKQWRRIGDSSAEKMAHTSSERHGGPDYQIPAGRDSAFNASWWAIEPDVGRVAYGVPHRVDRIRGLGNAVVPAQARAAFRHLLTGD
jgi:DNA (cytosine-5)-methyltransferase 1